MSTIKYKLANAPMGLVAMEAITEIEQLEQELQKKEAQLCGCRDGIASLKKEIDEKIDSYLELNKELQKTRERLEKAESILKVSVDINISGWQTYRMANQYFKDKDKQGE